MHRAYRVFALSLLVATLAGVAWPERADVSLLAASGDGEPRMLASGTQEDSPRDCRSADSCGVEKVLDRIPRGSRDAALVPADGGSAASLDVRVPGL